MFSAKQDHPTRREFLAGLTAVSAASAFPAALSAQNSAPSLCFTSAVDLAAMIRAKKLSGREALEEHLKQIDRVNPRVNAIVTLIADQATAAATHADEMQAHGETLGPLHGLPVAHKDLIDTEGVRTTYGSPLFKDHVATKDNLLVTRMRAADPGSLLTEQQMSALSRSCPQCKCGTLRVVVRCSAVEPPSPSLAIHCATFDTS